MLVYRVTRTRVIVESWDVAAHQPMAALKAIELPHADWGAHKMQEEPTRYPKDESTNFSVVPTGQTWERWE